MTMISRRDFMKLAGISAALGGVAAYRPLVNAILPGSASKPNILILVLDAMSAQNLSLYGYPRQTTPNLERFAERATVYNAHYSGGNFTTPGTASMLTGLYPWHHRALSRRSLVKRELVERNIFNYAGDDDTRSGFSQNMWSDLFLRQFRSDIDLHVPSQEFSDKYLAALHGQDFPNDSIIAYYAFDEFLLSSHQVLNPYPGSALWGYLDLLNEDKSTEEKTEEYPYGLPNNSYFYYRHPDVFTGLRTVIKRLSNLSSPWFAYFHLFSPHAPYRPRKEFTGIFPEIKVPYKPRHPLASNHAELETIKSSRDLYDEFLADLDSEFGKFIDLLEKDGTLDSSYVIVTSDHGEVFERGELGHGSPLLYEPVIRIPLVVSAPGQKTRRDVYLPTSNTDLLPTVAHLCGDDPEGMDGQVLPELGGAADEQRSVFSMVAKDNSSFLPIQTGSVTLIQGEWKLIHYFGYPRFPFNFELYNLENDRQEKRDLYLSNPSILAQLKEELLTELDAANQPYRKKGSASP